MTDENEEKPGKEPEQKPEEKKPENPIKSDDVRSPAGEEKGKPGMVDGAILAAEKLKEQNDRKEALLEREEKLVAQKVLGGTTEAGAQPPKEEKLSDVEYAEALERGEVNPMKEDGFT